MTQILMNLDIVVVEPYENGSNASFGRSVLWIIYP